MADDLNDENNFLKRMIAWLEELSRKQDISSPFAKMALAFVGFFQDLLAGDDNPDFEDAPTAEAAATARTEYETSRRDAERTRYNADIRPAPERVGPQTITRAMALLARKKAEDEAVGRVETPIMPVDNARITSQFGMRIHPRTHKEKHHDGADIAPPTPGQVVPIKAPLSGVVIDRRYSDSYGLIVEIMDENYNRHFFAHLSSANVTIGQWVPQGTEFAMMGNTGHSEGVHLHYELRDPQRRRIDPLAQFQGQTSRVAQAAPVVAPTVDGERPAAAARPAALAPVVEAERLAAPAPTLKPRQFNNIQLPKELVQLREKAEDVVDATMSQANRVLKSVTAGLGIRLA